MAQPLNRDEIITLLDRLGGDDDGNVLDAARTLHARLAEAGATWPDLLTPEESGGDSGAEPDAETDTDEPDAETDTDEPDAETDTGADAEAGAETDTDEPDAETGADEPDAETDTGADEAAEDEAELPADKAGRDAESLALIEKLLARPGISDTFRRDMEGYRNDIAGDDFTDADLKYLRALDKRLSG